MAKGDGSISQIGRNKWRVQVSLGKDPRTGKYQRVTRTVNGTKADARRARDELRERCSGVDSLEGYRATFKAVADEWHERRVASGDLKNSTLSGTRTRLNVLYSYIGEYRLDQITPKVVDDTIAAMRSERGLSGRTATRYLETISMVLGEAERYGYIARNPCDKATRPKHEAQERRALSDDESRKLLESIDERSAAEMEAYSDGIELMRKWSESHIPPIRRLSCCMAVKLALATGMRIGEILALTWDRVDLLGASIMVDRSISPEGEVTKPKSSAGTRTVHIDGKTVGTLLDWKAVVEAHAVAIGAYPQGACLDGSTPVVCSDTLGHMERCTFYRWWRKAAAEAGLPGLKMHELRHTHATQLVASGVDLKTVQARIGHAKPSMTLEIYAHAVPERDAEAAEIVAGIYAK